MWYLILSVIFAVWVCIDGYKRKANFIPWAIGTAILGPIVLPIYLAKRPLLTGEVREGGTAWNVLKNFAIFWTITMAVAAIWGMATVGKHTAGLQGDAEKTGAAIGTVLGLGMIAALWFFPFVGAFILGFMLKKSSIVERGPGDQPAASAQESQSTALGVKKPIGWLGWIGIIFLGLIILGIIGNLLNRNSTTKQNLPQSTTASSSPPLQLMSWRCEKEYDYVFVVGEVKNVSPEPLKNILVMGTFRTGDGTFVKSEDALIEYNPILPGQTSPFKAGGTGNPAIKQCGVSFKHLMGGTIQYKDVSKAK